MARKPANPFIRGQKATQKYLSSHAEPENLQARKGTTSIGAFGHALAIPAQAEPPRTLVPVADPLNQLQGNLKEARTQAAEDLASARKALQVAAPKLSERLDNLAEAVKRLEEQTNEITEAVAKDAQAKPEETKELLAEQESINQRLERVKEALRRDANAQDASQKEGRERERDADDAVAMLENPPRDAEQSLEAAAKMPMT